MVTKKRFKIDKLIRDKLPETLKAKGVDVFKRILEEDEYVISLKNKLIEESYEVIDAANNQAICEELADVLEVVHSISIALDIPLEEIEKVRKSKKLLKGGFGSRIHNIFVEINSDNPNIDYYLKDPAKYPEIT